ncbi:collagenase-like [Cydia pomonella]|uniref:collagenase-like n=1 Tax=Cydia pomonella TaxID=82600 RepID=UPI002ADD57C2|nr:collagenase-like [Cydia pomonella]
MKVVIVLCVISLVAGAVIDAPASSSVEIDYHNKIGIPLAARRKAAEEALDFHGARIVGRKATSLGQYPYMAGVIITLANGRISICGSSLLTNTRALTAAHCWTTFYTQARFFTVVLGSTTLFSGGTRVVTADVEIHSGYSIFTLANDIAIMKFPWVTYTNNIRSIAIATGNQDFAGTWAWASGWGVTTNGGSVTTDAFLSHVLVPVISNEECADTYTTHIIRDTNICVATTGGRGPCIGDAGGPLATADNSLLIGVMSFTHDRGCDAGPTGFSRVSAYTAWIHARL